MRRPLAVSLLAVLALARGGPAAAFSAHPTKPIEELLDSNDPYQTFNIVAGYDLERTRRVGFAHCLPEVLVRVSGEPRLEHDPRVADLAAHADALVASYDYSDFLVRMGPVHDDQGTGDERPYDLVVRFDHAKIDAVLSELGAPPWRGRRPQVVPVLVVKGFSGTYLLSAEVKAGAEQRGSLATAARALSSARPPSSRACPSGGQELRLPGAPSRRAEKAEPAGGAAGGARARRRNALFRRDEAGLGGSVALALAGCGLCLGNQWRKLRRSVPLPNAWRGACRLGPRRSRLRRRGELRCHRPQGGSHRGFDRHPYQPLHRLPGLQRCGELKLWRQ